ncbi:MAG: alpha-xylosidase, partial [Herbiconiux sp.]|nr:alpha-xylosidase [Herbiconiux sp.]
MKFTDGFWQLRPGVTALHAQEAYDIAETDDTPDGPGLVITAPTLVIAKRGDVLNRPVLTTTLSSPAEGVIRVRIAHHSGGRWHGGFTLPGAGGAASVSVSDAGGVVDAGALVARISPGAPWDLSFEVEGRRVTGSGHKAQGYMQLAPGAQVDQGIVSNARQGGTAPSAS